jgi:hypothetical protein
MAKALLLLLLLPVVAIAGVDADDLLSLVFSNF